jgi:tetratricopeptide (TPR) repeat protein
MGIAKMFRAAALAVLLGCAAANPSPQELFEKGSAAFAKNDDQTAHQYFDLCVDADPKHTECLFHLGLVHRRMASGKDTKYKKVEGMEGVDFKRSAFEVAITAFTHAVGHATDAASASRYLTAMVEALDATGQYEAATDAGNEALRADQHNLEAATLLGEVLHKQSRWDEAEKIWRHVIALHAVAKSKEPEESEGGGMGWDLEDEDEGTDLAMHEVPFASSVALVRLGSVLHALGQYQEAGDSLQRGLKDVPGTRSIVDAPTKPETEDKKQEAKTMDQRGGWPTDPWWQLGDISRRSGDYALAADSMGMAVSRYPTEYALLMATADAHHRRGTRWSWASSLLQRQAYVRYFGWLYQSTIDAYPEPHVSPARDTFDHIFRFTSTSKLRHDQAQLQHLMSRSRSWGESKAGEMQRTIEEYILPAYAAMIKERQQVEDAREQGGPMQVSYELGLSVTWVPSATTIHNDLIHYPLP